MIFQVAEHWRLNNDYTEIDWTYMCKHLLRPGWIIKMKKLIGLPEPLSFRNPDIIIHRSEILPTKEVIEEMKQSTQALKATREVQE